MAEPTPRRTRIERGDYIADVLQGNNGNEPFWYYVLQRKGSQEILDLVKYDEFNAAIQGATEALMRMQGGAASAS